MCCGENNECTTFDSKLLILLTMRAWPLDILKDNKKILKNCHVYFSYKNFEKKIEV